MPIKGHNASHYFYIHPANKPEWSKNIHNKDLDYLLGSDPFNEENNRQGNQSKINGKTYFQHFNLPFAKQYFRLTTTYPGLLIGAGYSHPAIKGDGEDSDYQLGFFFDHTLGVPIIPGSTVKGVLKNVFPEHGNERDEKLNYVFNLLKKEGIGINNKKYLDEHWKEIFFKNGNVFFHAFPIKREFDNGAKLEFEKEESDYLRKKSVFEKKVKELLNKITNTSDKNKKDLEKSLRKLRKDFSNDEERFKEALEKYRISQRIIVDDAITPHPEDIFKEPTPLKFIKVPAGVTFKFQFKINNYKNRDINISADTIKNVFKQILLDFGICAKRNVGYGHFTE